MTDFPVDVVVTYVDDQDPVWRATASKYVNLDGRSQRWRSWDTFRYWLRGVARNMPWARTVHMVVSNPEQVPEYVDREKVHVVLHHEIIPESLLPTFNSTTIEMFLCRIPGLAERFVYSNDDMFAVGPVDAGDFFCPDGAPLHVVSGKTRAGSVFRMQCRNSYRLAADLAGVETGEDEYFAPAHSMTPMLKSVCAEVHEKAGEEIAGKCSKTRRSSNYTQYLFPDYALMTKRARKTGPSPHFRFFDTSALNGFSPAKLASTWCKIACVNDAAENPEEFKTQRQAMLDTLEKLFPEKSKFEK